MAMNEEKENCSICLDTLLSSTVGVDSVRSTPCEHKFHQECLYEWFQSGSPGNSCPLCQRRLSTPEQFSAVFGDPLPAGLKSTTPVTPKNLRSQCRYILNREIKHLDDTEEWFAHCRKYYYIEFDRYYNMVVKKLIVSIRNYSSCQVINDILNEILRLQSSCEDDLQVSANMEGPEGKRYRDAKKLLRDAQSSRDLAMKRFALAFELYYEKEDDDLQYVQ